MAKLTLTDLASLSNEASAISTINANMALIEAAMENTMSRDDTSPNEMLGDLDINSYKVVNVADPVADLDAVNLRTLRRNSTTAAGMFFKGDINWGADEPTDPLAGDVYRVVGNSTTGFWLDLLVNDGDFIIYTSDGWIRAESQGFFDARFNTAWGDTALANISAGGDLTGESNTAFGYHALPLLTDENGNTAIGDHAGHNVTNGNNGTYLGVNTGLANTEVNADGSTAVGYGAEITDANQMVLGGSDQLEILAMGEVKVAKLGDGLSIAEGTNGRSGAVNLTAGVAVVSNTVVGSESRIFLQRQNDAGTIGVGYSLTRTPGVDFTITSRKSDGSTETADMSQIAYFIVENSIEGE